MSYLVRLILIPLLIICSTSAKADDWNNYLQFMDRFYKLDNQNFKSISCNIEVPLTKNFVKQLHDQFVSKKNIIELKENLSEFSLTYDKGSGPKFKYPSLEVKIISEVGVTNPSMLRSGVEMLTSGFKKQIEGTVMQLQGLLEEFKAPTKSTYNTIKEMKISKDSYKIVYEKGNYTVVETYSKNRREIRQNFKDGTVMSFIGEYRKINDDKLFLTGLNMTTTNPMFNAEVEVKVSYKKIADVLFPSVISGQVRQTMQTIKQEGKIVTLLSSCVLR